MSSDLRSRIEEFNFDGPVTPALPFAARLAREHGWTRAFADRVVREYKRFVYLAVTAGRPVCPSEQVDAAWHLHLTYTRSYWKHLCGDVLGRPLHHDPTRGGPTEAGKHHRMYDETLAAYREAFGETPPPDVWPPAQTRFGEDAQQIVVNTTRNWVVPKARVKHAAAGLAVGIGGVLFATGCAGNLDPFGLKGKEFLAFLIPVMVAATAAGLLLRRMLRNPSAEPTADLPKIPWDEAAFLVGGANRLGAAAVAKLTADGHLQVSADGKLLRPTGPTPTGLSPSESAVFRHTPLDRTNRTAMKDLRTSVENATGGIERRLREHGHLLEPSAAATAAVASALPLGAVILAFGVPRLVNGLANDKPVGFLVGSLVIAGIVTLLLLINRPRRSRKGDEAVSRLKSALDRIRNPQTPQYDATLPMAVALFGTTALAGSQYAALRQWYPHQTAAYSSGCGTGCGGATSGGGGEGGGSGCGSGCGGCGGGD